MENWTRLTKEDCGKEMTQAECRKVQLDMLDALDAFCKEHNLRYFLSGGTLLGAIRHKGFIHSLGRRHRYQYAAPGL